jgi:hypothetical protein
MKAKRQLRPLAVLGLLGASSICGCMPGNYLCSTPTPHGEVATACQTLPPCQRNRVHVFLVNGLDPCGMGKLYVTRDYVQRLGFEKTYLGQLYASGGFEDKIRHLYAEHPDTHFVLIGFGYGANLVKCMANDLRKDGITVDLLVYLAGDTLENTPEYRPENVVRIVNVTGQGCVWNMGGFIYEGVDIDNADNLRLKKAGHYDVPTNLQTLDLLTCRLGEVAARAGTLPLPVGPGPALPEVPSAQGLSRK